MADNYVMKGLQFIPLRLNSDALGTLGSDTAIVFNNAFVNNTQSFLVKQLGMHYNINGMTAGDNVIVGLANGSATAAEIASSMTQLVTDPDDASSLAVTAAKQIIFWETIRSISCPGTPTGTAATSQVINEMVSLGGGKGIPLKEDNGLAIFAFNTQSGALTTGGVVNGFFVLKGVWLND